MWGSLPGRGRNLLSVKGKERECILQVKKEQQSGKKGGKINTIVQGSRQSARFVHSPAERGGGKKCYLKG